MDSDCIEVSDHGALVGGERTREAKVRQGRRLLGGLLVLAGPLLGACGAPFETATSAAEPAEAGRPEAAATPDGGTPDAAPDVVYAAEAGADADAGPVEPPEFIVCGTEEQTGSFGLTTVVVGCGLGWTAAKSTLDSPAQLAALAAAGPYMVTMYPADGPPVRCISTDPPAPVVGVCPWTVSTTTEPTWVRCIVTSAVDGGTLGSGPSCQSEEAP